MTAPTREQVIQWAREVGLAGIAALHSKESLFEQLAALAYAAGQASTPQNHIEALVGDRLTAQKAAHIIDRDGYAVTGVVLTLPDGRACIVNRSAVRWLHGNDDLFNLLHTDTGVNQRQAAKAVAEEREACAKVAQGWECVSGGGAYQTSGNGNFWDAGNDYDQGRIDAAADIRARSLAADDKEIAA